VGKNQTEKSPYKSGYSPSYITPAQYITELVCENIAFRDRKELFVKFWNSPEWSKVFRDQLDAANGLVKTYSPKAIIAALKSRDGKNILSLRWEARLDPLIRREQAKIDLATVIREERQQEKKEREREQVVENKTRPSFGKKSVRNL